MVLSEEAKKVRERIILKEDVVLNPHSCDYPGSVIGVDDSWDVKKFKKQFRADVVGMDTRDMEFDLVGIDAAVVNAFRRIALVEIPTIAIENVWIFQNTSVMPDEMIAQRLGLVPLNIDPDLFEYFDGEVSDMNVVSFTLKAKMGGNQANKNSKSSQLVETIDVKSGELVWQPEGGQVDDPDLVANPPGPIHDDILLLKLAPGQEIDMLMQCKKNIGKEHSKWSPVATASYRLLNDITLKERVLGDEADQLAKCFSEGVIEVRINEDGEKEAFVKNPRNDTVSREVFRHNNLREKVELSRIRDHFIFSIESTGAMLPQTIFFKAIGELSSKCDGILEALDKLKVS